MFIKSLVILILGILPAQAKDGFTKEEQLMLAAAHNYKRAIVNPPAANMLMMSYSEDLGKSAQDWANKCIWDHGKADVTTRIYKSFGQNLWAGTGSFSLNKSVTSWDDEKKDYTLATNACADKKMCGHYTQVAWAKSNLVGCGVKKCKTMEKLTFENAHIVVCHYNPPGNYRGVPPYIQGKSCSQCPSEADKCNQNMCATKAGSAPHPTPAPLPSAATSLVTSFFVVTLVFHLF